MKKHLLGGIAKGAFGEAEAEAKFEAWKNNKQSGLAALKAKQNSNFLLRQGLAPTAHLVYYCVKELSRFFFQILDAGRRSPKAPFIGELAAKGGLRG